jgi:hypothetical protein
MPERVKAVKIEENGSNLQLQRSSGTPSAMGLLSN